MIATTKPLAAKFQLEGEVHNSRTLKEETPPPNLTSRSMAVAFIGWARV